MKEFSHDPHFAATSMLRTVGALVEGVSVLKIPPFLFPRKGFGDRGIILPGSCGFYSDATSLAPSIQLTTITCSWASFYMELHPLPNPREPKIQAGGLICLWPLPSSSCFRVGPWTLAQVESNCYFRSPIALPLFHHCLTWNCNTCPPFFSFYIYFLFTNNSTT